MEIWNIIFGVSTIIGVILSIYFYLQQRLCKQDLDIERKHINELRGIIHWQLQAIHHQCNRIENIMLDPNRPDKGVIEVARSIRDSVDSLMGELLGEVYVFPWANIPIKDPKTEDIIGRLIDTRHQYKENYIEAYPYVHQGAYIKSEQQIKFDESQSLDNSSEPSLTKDEQQND